MPLLQYLKVPKIEARVIKDVKIEPLRILFCGSDAFSIASLRKLHKQHQIDKSQIASIDVVCRPGKPVGRGLKTIRHTPVSETAKELGLPLHEIDTFTKWEPPKPQGAPINLVVAVSFGLFVPPRILGAAKYGGLNVHPSILPDFYGPAPLHHTLLSDCPFAGVTVQTLHSELFDRGIRLLQHPYPGIKHNCRTVEELSQMLAPKGGDMLVDCIKNHLYLYGSVLPAPEVTRDSTGIWQRYAPKITTADRFIDWHRWTGQEIKRRNRVIGPLWSLLKIDKNSQTIRRIIWISGFKTAMNQPASGVPLGQPIVRGYPSPSRDVLIRACDGQMLSVRQITIEGGQQAEPLKAAIDAKLNNPDILHSDGPLFLGKIKSKLPKQYQNNERSSKEAIHRTPTEQT